MYLRFAMNYVPLILASLMVCSLHSGELLPCSIVVCVLSSFSTDPFAYSASMQLNDTLSG